LPEWLLSQRPFSPRDFLAELSQRRVTRVAAVYAVCAWAVVQVADTVLPRLGVPDWSVTLIIVLALLGFPVALALAWAFDITPEGLKRTRTDALDEAAEGGTAAAGAQSRGMPVLLVAGVLVLVVGIGLYARHARANAEGAAGQRSIAVLPFVDMSSARNQEYFADGLTEELLNALAGIDSLRVAARTSSFAFKGKNLPIREVAAQLAVNYVVEGSVRREGDQLRITAQLIKAADGYHVWSETYRDRQLSDVFAIQEEISRAIAAALRIELGLSEGENLVSSGTGSTLAHDHYLKGRYYWNRRTPEDLRRAAEFMKRAVADDPGYARAWVGLAAALELLPDYDQTLPREEYVGRARAAVARALALEPNLGEAHSVLGDMLLHFDWDYEGSEREHLIALELVPNDATAHSWYAEVLEVTDRMDEALEHRRIALRLDPLDPKINTDYASILAWQGRLDEALAQLEATLALDPGFESAHFMTAIAALAAGRWDVAEPAVLRHVEDEGAEDVARMRRVLAGIRDPHHRTEALAAMRELDEEVTGLELNSALYVALGAHDDAIRLLEKRVATRDPEAPWIPTSPSYAPLRNDPRFIAITRRIRNHR
jgi:TolB-like protein/Tfp pilus assembly protein PilF